MAKARSVMAVFHNRELKTNFSRDVALPAGSGGSANTAKIACNDYAWDNGFSHWAHFDRVAGIWLVFACKGRSNRTFLTHMPTQEAAEMWLVHRG